MLLEIVRVRDVRK